MVWQISLKFIMCQTEQYLHKSAKYTENTIFFYVSVQTYIPFETVINITVCNVNKNIPFHNSSEHTYFSSHILQVFSLVPLECVIKILIVSLKMHPLLTRSVHYRNHQTICRLNFCYSHEATKHRECPLSTMTHRLSVHPDMTQTSL